MAYLTKAYADLVQSERSFPSAPTLYGSIAFKTSALITHQDVHRTGDAFRNLNHNLNDLGIMDVNGAGQHLHRNKITAVNRTLNCRI
jgi:hypothetical protein